jgi:ABC-type transporter Mla MlaB component
MRVGLKIALYFEVHGRECMLKIERTANANVVLTVTGKLGAANMHELLAVLDEEPAGRWIVLDLKDLVLVDSSAVRLLRECEARGISLRNCPTYIRVWIASREEES